MRKPLDRRTFLKGAGVAIMLPFLEAMLPPLVTAQTLNRKRYVFITFPNGILPGTWNFGDVLSPLANMQSQVTVLREINNACSYASDGAHSYSTASILTQARANAAGLGTNSLSYASSGPQLSIDQVIADYLKGQSPVDSLVIRSPNEGSDNPALNLSNNYSSRISWRGNQAVTPLTQVSDVFNAIFGVTVNPPDTTGTERKKSILDAILVSAQSLQNKLGTADKIRLESYMESIREVEKRMPASVPTGGQCSSAGAPNNVPYFDLDQWLRAMLDLIAIAFQCGVTNVATLQITADGNIRPAPVALADVGLNDEIQAKWEHPYSHYGDNAAYPDILREINKWYVERFRYFLTKLQVSDGTGTVLDNSVAMLGANFGDSHAHSAYDMPLVMAGKGGGAIQSAGKTLMLGGATLASFHLTIAKKFGVNINAFGRNSFDDGSTNTSTIGNI